MISKAVHDLDTGQLSIASWDLCYLITDALIRKPVCVSLQHDKVSCTVTSELSHALLTYFLAS